MFRRIAPVVLALVGLAALAAPEAARAIPPRKPLAPIILERATQPMPDGRSVRDAAWTPTLTIRADGTWRAATAEGSIVGQLDKADLRDLQRAIARTRYRIDYGDYAVCRALPTQRVRIKTTAGTVSWATPCSRRPHASVLGLTRLAGELTLGSLDPREPVIPVPIDPLAPLPGDVHPIPPVVPVDPVIPVRPDGRVPPAPSDVLLRLSEMRFQALDKGGDGITIRVDGSWTSSGRSGVLRSDELASLNARIASVTLGPSPTPYQCAARLDGHGEIEVRGLGRHTWSIPCSSLHPSLASLVTEMRRLTR